METIDIESLRFDNKNFNKHTEFGMSLLERSLRENGAGRSVLVDKDNNLIAGNGIVEAAVAAGFKRVKIVDTDGETLVAVRRPDLELDTAAGRKMALADNATAAANLEWDTEAIAEVEDEFDIDAGDWGVSYDFIIPLDDEGEDEEENAPTPHDNAEAEKLLNDAMRENVSETVDRIDYTMKQGWLMSDLTLGAVKANFIKSKYYGAKYRGVNSLLFCPERFFTAVKTTDYMSQLRAIKSGGKAGIAGCRTISSDGYLLRVLLSDGYPIGGARMPLDFPANKAEVLYNEFSPQGRKPDVLDPCHGWGGRLVGALLADVNSYVGIDPSPVAHKGVERTYDAFKCYTKTKSVQLIQKCFEDVELEDDSFDIALTSPPYFDVEKYDGEQTSHVRYNNYEKWVEGFYRPLITKTYKALRKGGVFVLQVGSQSYPLEKDGQMIAEEVGFVCEGVRSMVGKTNNNLHKTKENGEVLIILRKGDTKDG